MLQTIRESIWTLMNSILLIFMLPTPSMEKMSQYGREDICFGKFYKAATSTNRRFFKEVFNILFYRARISIVENWPVSVEEYCIHVMGWSRKKYRDSFNPEERKCLSEPLESLKGDVSLFNKLIIKLFSDVNLPKTFFEVLRELKNIRNRVCHDQLCFNEDTLYTNMGDLKTIFTKLLGELQTIFSIDVSNIECQYCTELDEILAAPITGEGASYFDKMERFREDLMGRFITCGRNELFSFYSRLKILNPCTWLRDEKFSELQVDKIFTPLHISNHDTCTLIDIEALLVTEPVDEDTMEYTGILPSVIILTGIAGCGKSSLCRYLLHEWQTTSTNVTNLRSVDILIFIEARNIVTNSLVTFLQQNLLKETCCHFEEKDILPTLQKLNVLYVVDGMDEATLKGRQLLEELFSSLGNSRVILTTRPEFTSFIVESALSHHLTYLRLNIHGFSDVGATKFTSKIFQALEKDETLRKDQEKECLQFLSETGQSLGDHLKIPLTLALIIILWKDKRSSLKNISSVTKLYSEIFKMCSMKMLSRVRKSTSSTCLDLDCFVDKWLLKLGQVAYRMVKQDAYTISDDGRKSLTSFCNDYCIDSIEVLSAFLICEVYENLEGVKYTFSFIHKSQMEYLAGHYLSLMLESENELVSNNSSKNVQTQWLDAFDIPEELSIYEYHEVKKMANVYLFTIGHLCMKKPIATALVHKITAKLLSISGYTKNIDGLWRLVQESDKLPEVCKLVSNTISGKFIWKLQEDELCNPMDPTLQLLKNTDFTPLGIMLRIVGNENGILVKGKDRKITLRPYVNLKSILRCIMQKPDVVVILRIDQHFYNWGAQELSDAYLQEFSPNNSVSGFMGHLGVTGAKSIKLLKKLEVLNVRISNIEAMKVLDESIGGIKKPNNLEVKLRLDISNDVIPSSLPKLKHFPPFTIIMLNVSDETALWTAEVLTQLSKQYNDIEFLSSTLTPDGATELLKTLSTAKVKVKEKISVHTFNRPDEEIMANLQTNVKCKLEWW